jgi:4-hydroxybenzoyl-CoA thioesterase
MNQTFSKQEQIKFRHCDFAGIVFYPRFLEMLNDLVEDWFAEALQRPFSKIHETHGIPTVDLQVKFKKPARIGDVLNKKLWVESLGESSMVCGFAFDHADGRPCLTGQVTLVNVVINKHDSTIKSEPFTLEHRELITPFVKQ